MLHCLHCRIKLGKSKGRLKLTNQTCTFKSWVGAQPSFSGAQPHCDRHHNDGKHSVTLEDQFDNTLVRQAQAERQCLILLRT
jgi:hypothetical protein